MKLYGLLVLVLLLSGCSGGSSGARDTAPHGIFETIKDTPAGDIVSVGAIAAVGLATAGLLIFVPLLVWMGRIRLARTVGIVCVGYIVCGPILVWFGNNLTWVSVVVAVAGTFLGAVFVWRKGIPWVERSLRMDINRDGVVGHG